MVPKCSYKEIFSDKNKILVVLAHPDDAEVVAGGLITRLSQDKKQVRLVVTTNGGKGMQDKKGLTEEEFGGTRVKEQIKAGKILGIAEDQNFNLGLPDGEVEASVENIGRIVFHVRDFKPDIIITHNAEDAIINFNNHSHWVNHRDHRNTSWITLDAAYPYSRDRGFFTEQFDKMGLEPHTVSSLLITDSYMHPEVKYFDVTDQIETKKEALRNHPSAISPDYAEDYAEENKIEDGYFEPLRFVEVY